MPGRSAVRPVPNCVLLSSGHPIYANVFYNYYIQGRCGFAVADRRAKVRERVTQAFAGRSLWPPWPQQIRQYVPMVRAICFYRQKGQQRTDLVRLKSVDKLAIKPDLKGSQEQEREMHRVLPSWF